MSISSNAFHIVIDPAGDTKQAGRQLITCYERGVTLQFCEMLKAALRVINDNWIVTITRTAGDTCTQEQRAQIANQLNADLFVHISCFDDPALKPTVYLYYYGVPSTVPYMPAPYTLIPAHKAHEIVFTRTKQYVDAMYAQLRKQQLYTIAKPFCIPDARLKGLCVPSFTLEFGITQAVSWSSLVDVCAQSLIDTVHVLEKR